MADKKKKEKKKEVSSFVEKKRRNVEMELQQTRPNIQIPFEFLDCREREREHGLLTNICLRAWCCLVVCK